MATYRYWDIRRDIYEQCSNKALKKYRTFADMKKLFKLSYWLLLIGMLVCLIAYISLFLFLPGTFYWLIPVGGTLLLSIISEFFGSRMYNPLERKREIEEHSANLDAYIENIQATLIGHGIITKDHRDTLRKECDQQLSIHNSRYKSVSSKIFDMLVGVPLGAFISALIYKSASADIVISQLFVIAILGVMIIGVSNILKKITYYSDGHFKDQYLLDVLNELEYLSE